MSWIDWAIGWLNQRNEEDASKRAAEAARLQAEAIQQQVDQMRQAIRIPSAHIDAGGAGGHWLDNGGGGGAGGGGSTFFNGGGGGVFYAPRSSGHWDLHARIENEAIFLMCGLGPWIAHRAALMHSDENLGQPRRLYRLPFHRMSITVLHVYNHTLEPDGSRKEYWLQVPDEATTAADAVALSFGINPQFYKEAVAS